jgi:molybdopterin converting factor small subunit
MAEVRLLAGLRETVGAGRRRLALSAGTVGELLDALVAQSPDPDRASAALLPETALHADLQVLVNGRSIELLDGAATPLTEADTVTLHHVGARGYPGG